MTQARTRVQTVVEAEIGKRTVWFHGLTRRQFVTLTRRAGVTRWMRDGHGFCASIEDCAELLAAAEHALRWRVVAWPVDR